MNKLTILTDAAGFTTACAYGRTAMLREVNRVPLLSPIQVYEWQLSQSLQWSLLQTYTWDGLI